MEPMNKNSLADYGSSAPLANAQIYLFVLRNLTAFCCACGTLSCPVLLESGSAGWADVVKGEWIIILPPLIAAAIEGCIPST